MDPMIDIIRRMIVAAADRVPDEAYALAAFGGDGVSPTLPPRLRLLLRMFAAFPGVEGLTAEKVRRMGAFDPLLQAPEPEPWRVYERPILGPGGPLLLRLYFPRAADALPALVYLHGHG